MSLAGYQDQPAGTAAGPVNFDPFVSGRTISSSMFSQARFDDKTKREPRNPSISSPKGDVRTNRFAGNIQQDDDNNSSWSSNMRKNKEEEKEPSKRAYQKYNLNDSDDELLARSN